MADEITNYSVENDGGTFKRMHATRKVDQEQWVGETNDLIDEIVITPESQGVPAGLLAALDAVTAQILTFMQGKRTPKP